MWLEVEEKVQEVKILAFSRKIRFPRFLDSKMTPLSFSPLQQQRFVFTIHVSELNIIAMTHELISPQGLRIDGRRQNELRHICIKLGVLERCAGSAFYQQGNSKVIASCSGPKNPSRLFGKKDENFYFNVRVKFATFSKNGERQKQMKNSKKLNEFELNLKNIFKSVILMEKYEKSQLDLNIEVLQTDGGSEISAAVNAATLALIDAGICMKEYICACTASLTAEGVPLLDVSHLEEISGKLQSLNIFPYLIFTR